MSLRTSSFRRLVSTLFGSASRNGRLGAGTVRRRRPRSLRIDALEQRVLLTVTPSDVEDILVNRPFNLQDYLSPYGTQTYTDPVTTENLPVYAIEAGDPVTREARALTVDNDGDMVVAFTRQDVIGQLSILPGGAVERNNGWPVYNPVIDPQTGQPMTDANICARYLTDEVQRLTLPSGVVADNNPNPNTYAYFSLVYGGYEIQKLTFSATYEPFTLVQENMEFDVVLQFDENQDNIISPAETAPFHYDETLPLNELVAQLTAAVTTISQSPSALLVEALNSHEFLVHFNAPNLVGNQRQMSAQVLSNPANLGFLPAATVTTELEPVPIGADGVGNPLIAVHPTDPQLTALAIEQAFLQTSRNLLAPPTFFPPADRVGAASSEGPYFVPSVMRTAVPRVSVVPVTTAQGTLSTTQFDVTFDLDMNLDPDPVTGMIYASASGSKNHPLMAMGTVVNDFGVPLMPAADALKTIKEPSDEFRVNPPEVDNPFTAGPDVYDQTNASVAMDADGEFIIVWQSEVPNDVTFGSVSDIYGRRFTPNGVNIDPSVVPLAVTTGVRGLPPADAADVQTIIFDDVNAAPLTGSFRLQVSTATTGTIQFNSRDLTTTAAAIQDALVALGLPGLTVSAINSTDPYRFRVHFGGMSSGIDWPAIQYVADAGSPLAANVTVVDDPEDLLTFRVNNFTPNAQYQPSVAMDDMGGFVVVWANQGQDISYFNGIVAQRFDRRGARIGNEFMVNREDTSIHIQPYVGMSHDGHLAVTWTRTDDPGYIYGFGYAGQIMAQVYDPAGTVLIHHAATPGAPLPTGAVSINPPGAGHSTVAFDMANNFLIAADLLTNTASYGNSTMDSYAAMYNLAGQTIRPDFRVNSASFNLANRALWPLGQSTPHVSLDADGDVTIAYEGYAPDVSENIREAADLTGAFRAALAQQINTTTNADLLPYFSPLVDSIPDALVAHPPAIVGYEGLAQGLYSNGDAHGVVESILIAAYGTAPAPTDAQIGRLRAILEGVAGLVYGEANGVLFTNWDAGAQPYDLNVLHSDNVANAQRDGYNSRYIVAIDSAPYNDPFAQWANITLQLTNPGGTATNVVIPIVYTATNQVDLDDTANNIDNALEGLNLSGFGWPEGGPRWEGAVDVRILLPEEVTARQPTPWDVVVPVTNADPNGANSSGTYFFFEVTFQGEVHDQIVGLGVVNGSVLRRETQTVTITPIGPPTAGDFTLTVGGATTGPITFNPANLAGTANAIAAAIDAALGLQNTQVIYVPGSTYEFQITFGTPGANPPPITGQPEGQPTDIPPPLNAQISSVTDRNGGSFRFDPVSVVHTLGKDGLAQGLVSVGQEPDGDLGFAWTQDEEYTSGLPANSNVYVRRFNETTDTAGPLVSDVIALRRGQSVDDGATVVGQLTHLVLTFDEDMLTTDPASLAAAIAQRNALEAVGQPIPAQLQRILDTVINPENYILSRGTNELILGVAKVAYGMNKAADLYGQTDPLNGQPYQVNPIPSNKWEAVLTLDGNGADQPGMPALSTGIYNIVALGPRPATATTPAESGLRDRPGNPLERHGFQPNGADFSLDFTVIPRLPLSDVPIGGPPCGGGGDPPPPPLIDQIPPLASLAGGNAVAASAINNLKYLDVTFSDTGGSGLNPATITDAGAEFTLAGTAAAGVAFSGAATLVPGTTSTYRYAFTGAFSGGPVSVNFTAASFADIGGNQNAAATATLTVNDVAPSPPPSPASSPYSQTFTAGKPGSDQGWEYSSTGEGRIQVVSGKLRMDDTLKGSQYSLNEAILHVNLVNAGNVQLKFDHQAFGDEAHRYAQSQFTNHVNADLVAVSVNGTNWVKVTDLTTSFTARTFALDTLLTQAGQAAGSTDRSDVRIKFQQYDNDPWGSSTTSSDGRAFDNIQVTATPLAPEIEVSGNSVVIVDGDTTPSLSDGTDFGSADVLAGSVTRQFAIKNPGLQALSLTGTPRVQVMGANAGDFVVTVQPGASIAAGSTAAFEVRFDPSSQGLRTATLRIASNDSDEGLYDFTIQGTGVTMVPQAAPYSQAFTTGKPGVDQGWEYSSTGEGRIQVVSGRLRMDDAVKGGQYSLNEAILHLDLTNKANVQLKLTHQSFGDEAHPLAQSQFTGQVNADLVAVSIDGTHWVKVTDLTTTFSTRTFGLDTLLTQAGQAAGSTNRSDVRIKFQQYDNDPWGSSTTSSDGRAFDNIQVTATQLVVQDPGPTDPPPTNPIVVPQAAPYSQLFTTGKPGVGQGWEYSSTGEGRIQVVSGRLRMDDAVKGGQDSLNEAILHLDLTNKANVQLKLTHQSFGDEVHAYAQNQFTGQVNADLIAVSVDGTHWVKVTDLTTTFSTRTFALDTLLAQAGQAAGSTNRSDVRIKFQQYDNDPWGTSSSSSDGRMFDNIQVTATTSSSSAALKAALVGANAAQTDQALSEARLASLARLAIAQWARAGLPADVVRSLQHVDFVVTDLPGLELGRATSDTIYIDRDAAGHGWFVDRTPHRNEEFAAGPGGSPLYASDATAVDRMDLLTVVLHELGHVAGLDDVEPPVESVMNGALSPGIRRVALASDAVFSAAAAWRS